MILTIEIDGSMGEGGGSVVRTAIALSAVGGREITIKNIRANRPNPGLAPQHLKGVEALAALTDAEVEGAELNSQDLTFKPRAIKGGKYRVDIETAGSTALILQVLMPAAAFADGPVEVEVKGGTDNPYAPPIDYLNNVTLPILRRMGYDAEVELVRRGHYPRGGGIIRASIRPAGELMALKLSEPGSVAFVRGISHCVKIPERVAKRQAHAAEKSLIKANYTRVGIRSEFSPADKEPDLGPGTGIMLWAETRGGGRMGSGALGRPGKPAEQVGQEAARGLIKQLRTRCAVDRWLTDQLIPYLALAEGESEISSAELTLHALTNVDLVEQILDVKFEVEGEVGEPGTIRVEGLGLKKGAE